MCLCCWAKFKILSHWLINTSCKCNWCASTQDKLLLSAEMLLEEAPKWSCCFKFIDRTNYSSLSYRLVRRLTNECAQPQSDEDSMIPQNMRDLYWWQLGVLNKHTRTKTENMELMECYKSRTAIWSMYRAYGWYKEPPRLHIDQADTTV